MVNILIILLINLIYIFEQILLQILNQFPISK